MMNRGISIIIPTLNEEDFIVNTIKSVRSNAAGFDSIEIILVDSGSHDQTVELARPFCDIVSVNPLFFGHKYRALNKGSDLANKQVLMFLDADSIVPEGFDQMICQAINSGYLGGAFEYKPDDSKWPYPLFEWVNRIRYRLTKHYFGDQGVFCTKTAFINAGGCPEERIMEATYLCNALRRLGRLKLLTARITTSVRRFESKGPWRVLFHDAFIYTKFLLGISIDVHAEGYWAFNKKRK